MGSRMWQWQDIGLAALFFVLITVTVVGNVLIIAAVVTTRRLRTVTNCFVMSLAIADWLVGIFVMPLAVTKHLNNGKWVLGQTVCMVWVSCDVCVSTASILSLCAISIDRYLAVTQPLNYSRRRRSKRLAASMILCVWLLAVMITCPPMIWFKKETPYLNISAENESQGEVPCDYNDHKGYVVFSAMGSFFVPLIVMLYVYARISCVIAQRHDHLEAMNNSQPQVKWPLNPQKLSRTQKKQVVNLEEADLARDSSESEEVVRIASVMTRVPEGRLPARCLRLSDTSSRVSSIRRENKAAQTLSIVVGGFIACWLPFFVAYLVHPFLQPGTIPDLLMFILTWLGWINSAINPFIYAFYSPDFRLAFWRLTVRHCTPRQPPCRQLHSSSRQSMHLRDSVVSGHPHPHHQRP